MKTNLPYNDEIVIPKYPSTPRYGTVIRKDGTIVFDSNLLARKLLPVCDKISERKIFELLPHRQGISLKNMLNRADHCKSSQVATSVDNSHLNDVQWEVTKLFAPDRTEPTYLCLGQPGEVRPRKTKMSNHTNKCKAIADQAASGVLLQDGEGSILWANEKAARLLGVSANSLFMPHFLEKLWKTPQCTESSVPFEDHLPSGSGQPGLLPSSATLVIRQNNGSSRTLFFYFERITGIRPLSPSFILARIKEVAEKETCKSPVIPGLPDWAWMRREYLEQTIAKAKEAERIRIGHELHDNINQMLAVSRVYLSLLHPDDSEEKRLRDKTEHILLMAIEEIRCLSHGLVKHSAFGEGLITAIKGLVDDFRHTRLFNITFNYDSCEIETLDQAKKVALYRILQEHMNNIVKYSRAKNVHICLDSGQKGVRLSIEDDGVGFNKLTVQRGIGLTGIYKKAELCNGFVELLTSPGQGCVLKVTAAEDVSEN